ncbi:HesA/MoeB/ThiF family protein [Ponticoccus sp. SC2-23]|uniref:HesA/MoeB/ThiF family protein n=1 Tax=Alexandriicola marinus TaxID=2081710 RepID=UPI000FD6D8CB|nr:HesA/MoeB/ThiF family protein [Alexandriicola marinus]MBM1220129.1 HesA/MoeB/ThiF family protein [Ponticoccus sp. SC6-9]MBM1224815.1 HesA/MoeB/ThiF family protein [Ponticoccus sp. SC6-15]MBM1228329.1 HesA/MoeB/ThiF family protein [Ponticoccus sp. SC6-38]MBM1234034.1 HesA/MoeB/ThiF family protein [Ponticoccus sp. SC6-45]MBM1238830.1 HesA/MoeB/ThiF family protein [Ponticoccus sp. SC6-49]MBM1242612.1 HesA/MoeB/ThiF family protein [Ponticoccus sp. SC2-64]MBM1247558.1 HesA/MoeB/ThiF family pro
MILVGVMIATLWGIGWVMGAPVRARLIMIGILMAGVMIIQLTLPQGHPLREATGSDPRLWLLLVAFAVAVWLYRRGLLWLRDRARPAPDEPASKTGTFGAAELSRYARQIVLREIGGPGQKALKDAKVLIVGAGGLGSPALQYLAGAGLGTIGVIDDDVVDGSNLARQVIHLDARIGDPKVFSAADAIRAQNPFVEVRPYNRRLTEEIATDLIAEYDLVLDGSDNFATRYMVNRVSARLGKPLIAAALTQWEGQISVYDPASGTPCYECVFPEAPDPALVPTCAEAGVLGPLPGVVGAIMAVEAIKAITGAGEGLRGRLMIYDALYAETRTIAVRPRADCPICGHSAPV